MLSQNPVESNQIILMSDPRVAAIRVIDNGEAMVDLLNEPSLRVDISREFVHDLSPSISQVRAGVATRLVLAQSHLPSNMAFLIREGHRALSVQQFLFDRYLDEVRTLYQGLAESELIAEASKFVAPPHIAPHATGGAVDLTLIDGLSGQELEMGSLFNGGPVETAGATFTLASNISNEARANRKILCAALNSAGFVNYPTEWWHWSYGDRYWALVSNQTHAIYGIVEAS